MKSLIKSTGVSVIPTIGWLSVTGIVLPNASEPVGTKLRILFRVSGGTWKKFSGGAWADVATQTLTIDSVLSQGNTVAELSAISDSALLAWLKNANVEWAVAMEDAGALSPELGGIKLNGSTGDVRLSTTYTSTPIKMSKTGKEAVRVLGITVVSQTVGSGTVAVDVATKDSGEIWSYWQPLNVVQAAIDNLANPLRAMEMKFRVTLSVAAIGTGTAQITNISVKHQTDNVSTGIAGEGYIITQTLNIGVTATHAHLMVIRPPIVDSEVEAYLSMRAAPIQVEHEVLATGTGSAQTKRIAKNNNFALHTFKLFYDQIQQASNVYSVSANGDVSFVAGAGVVVTASYMYGWEAERWQKMNYDADYIDPEGMVRSQFDYHAVSDSDVRGALSTFKIALNQGSGSVTHEDKGKATGLLQNVKLNHTAKPETIVAFQKIGSTITPLPADKYEFEDASKLLYLTATKDSTILVSYSWLAPAPSIAAIAGIVNR